MILSRILPVGSERHTTSPPARASLKEAWSSLVVVRALFPSRRMILYSPGWIIVPAGNCHFRARVSRLVSPKPLKSTVDWEEL